MPAVFNASSESSPFTEVQLCCGFLIFGKPTVEHVRWEGMKLKHWLGAVPSQLRCLLILNCQSVMSHMYVKISAKAASVLDIFKITFKDTKST